MASPTPRGTAGAAEVRMRHPDIGRPRGIDDVASALLDLDFPVDRDRVAEHIGHILIEDRSGKLVSAGDALTRGDARGFSTSEEVVVAVAEGLGIGILEAPLSEIAVGDTGPHDDQQAASAGADQEIDRVDRDGGPLEQVLASDQEAEKAEDKEQLRARQRAARYEPPDGPAEDPGLDVGPRPALLDPSSAGRSPRRH